MDEAQNEAVQEDGTEAIDVDQPQPNDTSNDPMEESKEPVVPKKARKPRGSSKKPKQDKKDAAANRSRTRSGSATKRDAGTPARSTPRGRPRRIQTIEIH